MHFSSLVSVATVLAAAAPSVLATAAAPLEDRHLIGSILGGSGLLSGFSGYRDGHDWWGGVQLGRSFQWDGISCSNRKPSSDYPSSWISQGWEAPVGWSYWRSHSRCTPDISTAVSSSVSCAKRDHIAGWLNGEFACAHRTKFGGNDDVVGGSFTWGGNGCSVRVPGVDISTNAKCPVGWGWSSKHGLCTPHCRTLGAHVTPKTDGSCWITKLPTCSTGRFILDKFACSSQGTPAIVGRNDLHLPSLPLPSVSVPSTSGSCKSDEFFWSPKSVCLPTFSWSSCPKTQHTDYSKSCPSSWYFHSSHKCCVPRAPRIDLQPKICAQSSWNWFGKELCCKSAPPTSVSDCSSSNGLSEFFWKSSDKALCIPKSTGFNDCPAPPAQYGACPSGWGWHSQKSCCTPKVYNPSTPSCQKGCKWWNNRCEYTTPVPSGHAKRNARSRAHTQRALPLDGRIDSARCPSNLTACPIEAAFASPDAYECLDPVTELTSCGGCASLGQGQDCTEIENSSMTTCSAGACKVLSCKKGLAVSLDGKSCI